MTTEGADEGGWQRTSRLGFVVQAIAGLRNMVLPLAAILYGSSEWQGGVLVLPLFAAVLAASLGMSWLAWRKFRYRLGEGDIRVEKGLLNRTARAVPYERIQDVSLEQGLLPRLFGLVQVKFETGAGGKDELKLAYVSEADGEALREAVRARKSGEVAQGSADEAGEESGGRTLFAMDLKRLITFGFFEFSLVVFAVLGGAAQQFEFLLPFDIWDPDTWFGLVAGPSHALAALGLGAQVVGAVLALGTLAVVGLATGIVRTVLRDYGFLLEETPKGFRRRRGLLTRTDVVMPVHRVQALKLTTGIVRRRFGWHALSVVSLATDAKAGNHVVVPFGTMAEIEPVVGVAGFGFPDEIAHWHRPSPRYRFDKALLAAILLLLASVLLLLLRSLFPPEAWQGMLAAAVLCPVLAAINAGWQYFLWRHDRHAIDGERIYVRRGWLSPTLDIASRIKLQAVEIAQGPVAIRRGYASLIFGIAGGTLEIRGVPIGDARLIREGVLASLAKVDFSRLPG